MQGIGSIAVDVQTASHASPVEWLWSGALLLAPFVVTAAVFLRGRPRGSKGIGSLIDRPAAGLEATTGRPAWSAAGVQIGLWALTVAAIGFFWDVAWHIDLGRDQELFTPPHTLIVAGLLGLAVAGAASSVLATRQHAEAGFRIGRLRVPWGAAGLLVLGSFATVGFPLDALWHATYGVDVTMWSPTHLTMISGAAFAPIAVWLLDREGGPRASRGWTHRLAKPMLVAAMVVALAAFQLEFDDGVPQWQMLYQPVLIALGATVAMTVARVALGRGWALWTAAIFLAFRAALTLLVAGALSHVVTHIPLYLGIAACVELGFILARRRPLLIQGIVAGGLAGTAGLATEWLWSQLWSYQPWQSRMLPAMWVALMAALAGGVLGTAMGGVLGGLRARIGAAPLLLAGVAVLLSLAVPFPRHDAPITATVTAIRVGPARPATDRFGAPTSTQDVVVDATVAPATGADDADVFRVIAWQGGGRVAAPLHEIGPGRWETTTPVPTGGAWKTIVLLIKGDVLAASPVALPNDPQYGQPPIPLARNSTAPMVPAAALLTRETHSGAPLAQFLAYTAFTLELLIAFSVLAAGYVTVGRGLSGSVSAARRHDARARSVPAARAARQS